MALRFALIISLLLITQRPTSAGLLPMGFWNGCGIPRATCLAHYNAGCRSDGTYTLLIAGTRYSVTCDMSDGGGWTQIKPNLITSSTPTFNASGVVSGNNVGQSCGGTSNNVSITGTKISFTKVKVVFTRTTTIMQCVNIAGST